MIDKSNTSAGTVDKAILGHLGSESEQRISIDNVLNAAYFSLLSLIIYLTAPTMLLDYAWSNNVLLNTAKSI